VISVCATLAMSVPTPNADESSNVPPAQWSALGQRAAESWRACSHVHCRSAPLYRSPRLSPGALLLGVLIRHWW